MAQNINLYEAPHRATGSPVTPRGVMAVAALLVAALASLHWLDLQRNATLNDKLARMRSDRERMERQVNQLPASDRTDARLQKEELEVAALEGIAARLSSGALGRAGGFTEHLSALSRAGAEGVWLTGIRIDNGSRRLVLEGRALDAARVPQLFVALRGERLFEGMDFAALELKVVEAPAAGAAGASADIRKGQQPVQFRVRTPEQALVAVQAQSTTQAAGATPPAAATSAANVTGNAAVSRAATVGAAR
jgi:hypothetical protein